MVGNIGTKEFIYTVDCVFFVECLLPSGVCYKWGRFLVMPILPLAEFSARNLHRFENYMSRCMYIHTHI